MGDRGGRRRRTDTSVPFRLVAGLVRNEKEAAALVQLDVLSMQAEAIQEHLAAAACYDFALCKTAVSLATETADQPVSTNTALSLLLTGLRSVRSAELRLLVRAAAVESKVSEVEIRLQEHANANRATASELADEDGCVALAARKRKLWLVEESLCHRIQQQREGGAG